jgi:hypothetical protein
MVHGTDVPCYFPRVPCGTRMDAGRMTSRSSGSGRVAWAVSQAPGTCIRDLGPIPKLRRIDLSRRDKMKIARHAVPGIRNAPMQVP